MTRRTRAAAALLAVAVAGCTGGEAAVTSFPSPAAGVTAGGELRVGIVRPVAIDPALVPVGDVGGTTVVRTMCDTLVQLDPETGEVVPAIARSWKVLEGGSRFLLRLRDDVRFSDGSKLTAQDVAASLARIAAPETVSPVAELLEHVGGYAALRDEEVESDQLTGVRAVNTYDVEITLGRHDAQFLNLLASPLAAPVPRGAAERTSRAAFAARPVCSGPYRLTAPWDPERPAVTLERTPGYRPVSAGYTGGGAGYAERIVFRLYPTREAATDAFRKGDVDVAPVANDALEAARGIGGAGMATQVTGTLEYVGLPVRTAPFDEPAVRRALSLALDRRAIAREVYGGARVPATSLLPPTLPDGLVDADACEGAAPEAGDVAAARAVLAGSGADLDGRTVPFYFNDEFHNRELMAAVAAQWRAAFGLQARLVPLEWSAYLTRGTGSAGFDGPFRLAHAAPYPSASEFLGPLFSSGGIGSTNLSRFSSRPVDRALERDARRAIDPEDQRREYALLHRAVCTQLPVVPVVFGTASYLVRDTLAAAGGRMTDRTTATPLLRELHVR